MHLFFYEGKIPEQPSDQRLYKALYSRRWESGRSTWRGLTWLGLRQTVIVLLSLPYLYALQNNGFMVYGLWFQIAKMKQSENDVTYFWL